MDFFSSMALMLGFGSATDHMSVEQIIQRAEAKITHVLRYHPTLANEQYRNTIENIKLRLRQDINQVTTPNGVAVSAIPKLLQHVEQELVLGSRSNLVEIPSDLKRAVDNGSTIFQLQAFNQFSRSYVGNYSSCGLWSIFNARALDRFIIDPEHNLPGNGAGIELNAAAIEREALTYLNYIPTYYTVTRDRNRFLAADAVIALAQEVWGRGWRLDNYDFNGGRISNFYVLGFIPDSDGTGRSSIWLQNVYNRVINLHEVAADGVRAQLGEGIYVDNPRVAEEAQGPLQNELYNDLRRETYRFLTVLGNSFHNDYNIPNRPCALHFACNLYGHHWILISIVKLVDRNPVIVVLDSLNSALDGQGKAYALYLYNLFIRPFIPNPEIN
jgi:hypothetical protein